ncbi:PIN domain-containing protein [Janthinobacterium sp. HH01]|uniref:type II toxin-antitoxin system VapC family toxin n=1 Tax=Janthinobacterium sp. HH01 TaxID=1198452 RepID=UPI0002AE8BCB|nr:type II toxin-antitoxin system VapC family toxin [Janthinobacterium sp. HH01]ELX11186.1 PIN domain-containing protein [Janthinobacterium sp. HH01]
MIMLDTHALIWWRDSSARLSPTATAAIAQEVQGGKIGISAFSFWEIALLVEHNRLRLPLDLASWVAAVEAIDRMRFIPVDNEIAVTSVRLPPGLHKDPADRIIVATAMLLDIPIVTADRKIHAYPHVQTIW